MKLICPCGERVKKPKKGANLKRFCSSRCRDKEAYQRRKLTQLKTCQKCGGPVSPSSTGYCKKCFGVTMLGDKNHRYRFANERSCSLCGRLVHRRLSGIRVNGRMVHHEKRFCSANCFYAYKSYYKIMDLDLRRELMFLRAYATINFNRNLGMRVRQIPEDIMWAEMMRIKAVYKIKYRPLPIKNVTKM